MADNCIRQHNDFVGYQRASSIVIFLFIICCTFLLSFCVLCYKTSMYSYERWLRKRNDMLIDEQTMPFVSTRQSDSGRYRIDNMIVTIESREAVVNRYRPVIQMARRVKICKWISLLGITGFALFSVFGVYYFPTAAKYSICSKKIEWLPVIEGILHQHVDVPMNLQISVYNPNKFRVNVQSLSANLIYQNNFVASGNFSTQLALSSGSVDDTFVYVHFFPTVKQALSMLAAFSSGKLLVDVEIKSAIDFFFLHMSGTFTLHDVDLTHSVAVTREYCKCV